MVAPCSKPAPEGGNGREPETKNQRTETKHMNTNAIPRVLSRLLSLAARAKAATEALAASLGIVQNTAAKIGVEIVDLTGPAGAPPTPPAGKIGILNDARQQNTAAQTALRAVIATGRTLAMQAIDVLRPILGRQWNARWNAAGFSAGSLAVPRDPYRILIDLREYFRRNTTHEVPVVGVTAALLDAKIVAIEAARRDVDSTRASATAAKDARDLAQQTLQKRLSSLRYELDSLLANDDARWYEFGFRRPIDGRIPATVENLTVTPALPGELIVSWDPASLADNYAVSKLVVGSDPVLVFAKRVNDTETILRDLPAGATVKVTVVSHNSTGDSLPVEAAAIVG